MKFFIFCLLIYIKIICSYINIPFKTYKSDDINNLFYNFIYVNIDVGEPRQNNSKLVLNQGSYPFVLYDKKIYSNVLYDSQSSNKYIALENNKFEISSKSCKTGIYSMETFYIQNYKIDSCNFILCSKAKKEEYKLFDGQIGLNIGNDLVHDSNFVKLLKSKNIINNYIYSIYYINDDEGFLLLGEYPHNLNINLNLYKTSSDFKESNLLWVKSEIISKNIYWMILFDKISYGQFYHAQREAKLSFDIKYIISTTQYHDNFKEIFGKKCEHITFEEDFQGFKCRKDINKELTPKIEFYNKELNTTFTLDYKDLYMDKGNFSYFLVATYFDYDLGYWILGKPFMKKYLFLYNSDNKMIGFYKNSQYMNNGNTNKIDRYTISICLNIFLALILIILIFVFYHYYIKRRRIRANELEDKFNYVSKNDNNEHSNYSPIN